MNATPDIAALYDAADALRRERRIDAALEAFTALIPAAEAAGDLWAEKVFVQALNCAVRLKAWAVAEGLGRRAVAACPSLAPAWSRLGEALLGQGRGAEAVEALQQALALDPEDADARVLLHLARRPPRRAVAARRTRAWPVRQAAFAEPAKLVRQYVLRGHPADLAIGPRTRFVTIGSCFAYSLGKRLAAAGHPTVNEEIGEEVNSPLANQCLFDWIEHGPVGDTGETLEAVYGASLRARLREAVASSDVVVLTLGVAPCFFEATEDGARGDFVFLPNGSSLARDYLAERCVMRTTTVAENLSAIGAILDAVARLSGGRAKVVLTVSPVPLAGTNEFASAVVADCLSKSTLRLACHEALEARPDGGAVYWPSFEIVRWLGAHYGPGTPPAFGADDANSRHVSRWMVKMIVGLFLEHYAADRPSEDAQDAAA